MSRGGLWAGLAAAVGLGLAIAFRSSSSSSYDEPVGKAATAEDRRRAAWLRTVIPVIAPLAVEAGAPVAVAVAQACLETGFGKAVPAHNLYGMKGEGPAGSVNIKTREEYAPGSPVTVRDNFRAYHDEAESVADWLKLLASSRYRFALHNLAASPGRFILYVWGVGYATASNYPTIAASVSRQAAKLTGRAELGFTLTADELAEVTRLSAVAAGPARVAATRALFGAVA